MRELNRQLCAHCGETNKSRNRDFSAQIWSVLLYWGEINESAVNQPICDSCYRELRNLLIDRSKEMETVLVGGLTETLEDRMLANPANKQESKAGKKPRAKISKASGSFFLSTPN